MHSATNITQEGALVLNAWDRMNGRRRWIELETTDPEYDGHMRVPGVIKANVVTARRYGAGALECFPTIVLDCSGDEVSLVAWSLFVLQSSVEVKAELASMCFDQAI